MIMQLHNASHKSSTKLLCNRNKAKRTKAVYEFQEIFVMSYQRLHLIQLEPYFYFHGIVRVHDRARKLITI